MSRTKGSFSIHDEQKRIELYREGKLDGEIAKELGYAVITIAKWRMSRGLPANGGSGWGGLRVNNKRHNLQRGVKLAT